ncbi:bifunctional methylenetetrahydrofolate dehydrogenase/cyclohydrolase, mitochondrial isoform X1 [Trichoplusia ni]|uniref:methenyltetrahydrofolate cyclohydrolase n=2 Tax=Trichoplusia ni TaxID=7111 RepID=A0A7E5WKH7_TRINI|nr:bifunctional methylenetetrahydrofolate dehydrogenase/cyclohydrolase, mitochondrial isoform X1 [Trichoplusia ni]XP_026741194.1 bifunctional methylenetetrahydrofolate dehydrogenase/cyclohydrolase, mitochondrial isoform X1 [Trichoplusia ni]XP_026741195.1 bifunctional methylenetetrahydrofolate dehydrogenase/cyclohydrolase, mitochondrial isoform X1 [Trichoplusia ni]
MRQILRLRVFSSLLTSTMRSHTYIDSLGSASSIMARVLDGKALAAEVKNELKLEIANWVNLGHRAPSIRCILVGDDPASHTYVNNKIIAARFVGIDAEVIKHDSSITEEQLLREIETLNADSNVDGILVQLPIPETMSERKVCNAVAPEKDVDGFHIVNIGQLCVDMPTMVPATALAVIEMLKRFKIETFGRNAVVVGRSKNVGLPIAMMLHSDKKHDNGLGMDATVTICHRYTPKEKLDNFCQNADIIITATGVPKLIKANMVKPGATIIDVGITKVTDENGKSRLVGDVDYDEVSKVAGALTPVPGGVGPMTVAMLMHNTFQAAKNLRTKSALQ